MMTKPSAILLLTLICVSPVSLANKSPSSDTLFRALDDELKRTVEKLQMDGLGKPYFTAFTVDDERQLSIEASFGAIQSRGEWRSRQMKIDLRVGTSGFDNSHYSPDAFCLPSPETVNLVIDDDYDALRRAMWTAVDEAYKNALLSFSQKKAYRQRKMIKNPAPDLSKQSVQSSIAPIEDLPLDGKIWEARARELSAVFRGYSAIQSSQIAIRWTQRYTYFVDSEGRKVRKPGHNYEIYMEAATQARDGMRLSDHRRIIRQSLDQLPSFESLKKEAISLARDLSALSRAPVWSENYIGPVLFEDMAAGDFFNQLLAHNVSFPREIWVGETYAFAEELGVPLSFHKGSFAGHLGFRGVSPILSVEDNPSLEFFGEIPLIGFYHFDDEGIPAQRVSLVENGVIQDVLMSRAPIEKRLVSNGHGRGGINENVAGRVGNLIVTSSKAIDRKELKNALVAQARELGLSYGVLIRRIGKEDKKSKGQGLLAPPVLIYKVHVADGREELYRNAQFTGVTLRALRDVVLTSDDHHVYNYYQLGINPCDRGGTPASLVHPAVLVQEMELKKSDKQPEKLSYLKHPHFEKK